MWKNDRRVLLELLISCSHSLTHSLSLPLFFFLFLSSSNPSASCVYYCRFIIVPISFFRPMHCVINVGHRIIKDICPTTAPRATRKIQNIWKGRHHRKHSFFIFQNPTMKEKHTNKGILLSRRYCHLSFNSKKIESSMRRKHATLWNDSSV